MASPRRIDVHFHLIPPFYREAVYEAGTGPAIGKYPDWTPQLALELMDACGIEVALTSLAQPGVGFGSEADARRRWRGAATTTRPSSPRAGPGASAPSPPSRCGRTQGALDEIAYSLDVLKLDGVSLFASYGENFLGDPRFDPVLAAAERARRGRVRPSRPASLEQGLALPWPAS